MEWRPRFMPGSVHVGSVVDKVAMGDVLLQLLQISHVNIFPPWVYILIYHLEDD
jgi:hypothetical protein